MKKYFLAGIVVVFGLFIFGCNSQSTEKETKARTPKKGTSSTGEANKETKTDDTTKLKAKNGQTVKLSTKYGDMVLLLYDETPKHRDNFVKLVNEGFYNGTLFHRVMKDFMAQKLWRGKGSRLSSALSVHNEKGTHYMSYKMQQTFKSFYFDSVLNFIPKSLLKPFFPVNNTAKYQGVEKAVYHREIKVENIRKLKFRNTTYVIVPEG